ncbi:hypothetical protein R6Q59_015090 [Mikania micrantha]
MMIPSEGQTSNCFWFALFSLTGPLDRQIRHGINGSRDLKISRVADAGYYNNIFHNFINFHLRFVQCHFLQSHYKYRELSSLPEQKYMCRNAKFFFVSREN